MATMGWAYPFFSETMQAASSYGSKSPNSAYNNTISVGFSSASGVSLTNKNIIFRAPSTCCETATPSSPQWQPPPGTAVGSRTQSAVGMFNLSDNITKINVTTRTIGTTFDSLYASRVYEMESTALGKGLAFYDSVLVSSLNRSDWIYVNSYAIQSELSLAVGGKPIGIISATGNTTAGTTIRYDNTQFAIAYVDIILSGITQAVAYPINQYLFKNYDGVDFFGLSRQIIAKPPNPWNTATGTLVAFQNKEALANYLKSWGLPFSIDGEDYEIDDGQPDNTPDPSPWGGGDNSSDDIVRPDGSTFPTATAANMYVVSRNELDAITKSLFAPEGADWVEQAERSNLIISSWVSCYCFPFDVVAHDAAHIGGGVIKFGTWDTDISAATITSGYSRVFDYGELNVDNYYNNFLDYEPFTKLSIYLPYIGIKPLQTNKYMGKRIRLRYYIDFVTGMVTADISSSESYGELFNSTNRTNACESFDIFTGRVGMECSVTGETHSQAAQAQQEFAQSVTTGAISLGVAAVAVIGAIPTGGATLAGAAVAATGTAAAVGYNVGMAYDKLDAASKYGGQSVQLGSAGGSNGIYCVQQAALLYERNITAAPANYAEIIGVPASYSGVVSEFTGYLECSSVELKQAAGMTQSEYDSIVNLLNKGVYI